MASKSSKQSHWPLSVLGGFTSLLNVFLPLSLIRVLTPEEIGEYKLFFFYVTMIPSMCVTVGITNGLFYWAGQRRGKQVLAFQSSWSIVLSVAICVLLLGCSLHSRLVHWLGWTPTQVWLFIWTGFLTLIASFYEDVKISVGEIWRGGLFSSIFEVFRNALIILVALKFRTIDSVMWTYASVMTVKTCYGLILGHIDGFQKLRWDRTTWAAVARYAAPVSAAGLLGVFTSYGDQVILSGVLTAAQFGVYSLGCLTVPPLFIFEISVNRVLIPNMSSAFNARESDRARALFRESVSELGWLLVPSAVALSLFAKPIVLLLFREKFIEAAGYLQVFAFSYLAFLIPFDVVARARGDGNWILKFLALFTPISILAIYIGVHSYGAMGALTGMMLVQFLIRAASIYWVSKNEKWKISEMLPWGDLAHYVAISALAAAGSKLVGLWIEAPLTWFAFGGALYTTIYLAGTMSLFFKRRNRALANTPVLLLARSLGEDELGQSLLRLSSALQKEGLWQPRVFVCDRSLETTALRNDFEAMGVKVIAGRSSKRLEPPMIMRLAKEALAGRVAIIHSHGLGTLVYAVIVKWISFGAVKIVHTHRGKSPLEMPFAYFADRICIDSADLTYPNQYEMALQAEGFRAHL